MPLSYVYDRWRGKRRGGAGYGYGGGELGALVASGGGSAGVNAALANPANGGVVRLSRGNYGGGTITLGSDQELYGFPGEGITRVNQVNIAAGAQNVVICGVHIDSLVFPTGANGEAQAVRNCSFEHSYTYGITATNCIIEDCLFLDVAGSYVLDFRLGGRMKNTRWIKHKFGQNPDPCRFYGNAQCTGNVAVMVNALFPQGESLYFENLPEVTVVGLDAEQWNQANAAPGAPLVKTVNVGAARLWGVGGSQQGVSGAAQSEALILDSDHVHLWGQSVNTDKVPQLQFTRAGSTVGYFNCEAYTENAPTGSQLRLRTILSPSNGGQAPVATLNGRDLTTSGTTGPEQTQLGASLVPGSRGGVPWEVPVWDAPPDPVPTWATLRAGAVADSRAAIQGAIDNNSDHIARLGAGTFYIGAPLVLSHGDGVVGAGDAVTAIVCINDSFHAIIGDDAIGVGQEAGNGNNVNGQIFLSDFTLYGGLDGVHLGNDTSPTPGPGAGYAGMCWSHVTFRSQVNAGFYIYKISGVDNNAFSHVNFVGCRAGIQLTSHFGPSTTDYWHTHIDKNLWFHCQFLDNQYALDWNWTVVGTGSQIRECYLNYWAHCRFENNTVAAIAGVHMVNNTAAHCDFVDNADRGGNTVIYNDSYSQVSLTNCRFVADRATGGLVPSGTTMEGCTFSRGTSATAVIISSEVVGVQDQSGFSNCKSVDVPVGNQTNGACYNSTFAGDATRSKTAMFLKASTAYTLVPGTPAATPTPQLLLGSDWSGGVPGTPASGVTIGTSTNATATELAGEHRVLFAPTDGRAFAMYHDGTNLVFRSAASPHKPVGLWSGSTTIVATTAPQASAWMNADDSINVLYQTSANVPTHKKLTRSGTTWTVGSAVTVAAIDCTADRSPHVLLKEASRLWAIVQRDVAGTAQAAAYRSDNDGTTWTVDDASLGTISTGAGDDTGWGVALTGTTLVFVRFNNGDLFWRTRATGAGAWAAQQSLVTQVLYQDHNLSMATDGAGRIILAASPPPEYPDYAIRTRVYTPGSDVWTSGGDIGVGTAGVGTPGTPGIQLTSDLRPSLVRVGADVYCFWQARAGNDDYAVVYKKWTNSTATWAPTATTVAAAGRNRVHAGIGAWGVYTIGALWTEGTASPYSVQWDTVVLQSAAPYHDAVVTDGAVLYYEFKEASGTSAADSSGNGNTGTYGATNVTLAAPSIVGGKPDTAVTITPGGQITCTPTTPSTLSAPFSVELWFAANNTTSPSTLFGTRGPVEFGWDLRVESGTLVHADMGTGAAWLTTAAEATITYFAGVPVHLVVTVSPTAWIIYANGVQQATGALAGTALLWDATHNLCLGNLGAGGWEFCNAVLDEVAVYAAVLTPTQVANHYALTGGGLTPNAPSGATAVLSNPTTITVSWTDTSSGESGFSLERSVNGGTFSQLLALPANTTSYPNINLTPNTSYAYRLRAFNAAGNSPYSNTTATLTTPAGAAANVAFSDVTVSALTSTSATVAWHTTSGGWVLGDPLYSVLGDTVGTRLGPPDLLTDSQVEYGLTTAYGATTTYDATVSAQHSQPLSNLNAGSLYHFRVRSGTGGTQGTQIASADSTFTTVAGPPNTPTTLLATTTSSTSISVTWTDNATNELAYSLEQATGAGSFTVLANLGPNTTSYPDTGLTPGLTYTYRVRCSNAAGNSAYSNTSAATTSNVPNAPTLLSALVQSPTAITISWTDNSSDETGFSIERALGAGGAFAVLTSVSPNVTTYPDTGLSPSTLYRYQVRAFNAVGNSGYTNIASATTPTGGGGPDLIPPVISGVLASATSANFTVQWTTDEPADTQLDWGLTSAYGTATPLDSALTLSHSVTVPAGPAQTIHYRARSKDAAGNLATTSGDPTVTTPGAVDATPPTITNLQVTAVTSSSATLTWTTSENADDTVDYGTTVAYGSSLSRNTTFGLTHARTVPGLLANTPYHARVQSQDLSGNNMPSGDLPFTTLAAGAGAGTLPAAPTAGTQQAGMQVLLALSTRPIETPVWTDVSQWVVAVSWQRGRDSQLSEVSAATAVVTLDNRDRRFDPTNTAGPYYGALKKMRRAKIRGGWDGAGYDQLTGYVEDWPMTWEGLDATVDLPIVDGFGVLALHELNRPFAAARSDVRLHEVLDDAGWTTGAGWLLGSPTQSVLGSTTAVGSTGDRLISEGVAQLQAADLRNVSALSHLQAVEQSELGLLFMTKEGQVRFRPRRELQQSASGPPMAIFGENAAAGELVYADAQINAAGDVLYNRALVSRDGSDAVQQYQDAASIFDYFARTFTATLLLDSDDETLGYAQAIVNRYKTPQPVIPTLQLDPTYQPALVWPTVLGRELGEVVTVRRRPPGGGAVLEQKSRIEGISCAYQAGDRPDAASWVWTWRLSPVVQSGSLWVLGSTTASVLGSTTAVIY